MTIKVVSELIESNVFIVGTENCCVIVDAGAGIESVKRVVGKRKVLGIFLTHGHYDHSYYVLGYAKEFGAKIYGSKNLKEYLQNPDYNYSEGHFKVTDFSNFEILEGAGKLILEDIQIEYLELGGHSKSDMCYIIGDEIFVGDVVLGRDIGRMDLYGGSKVDMIKSLQTLKNLDYSVMHCGHGEDKPKIEQDKVISTYLRFLQR